MHYDIFLNENWTAICKQEVPCSALNIKWFRVQIQVYQAEALKNGVNAIRL